MFRETLFIPIDPIPQEYTKTLTRLENEPDYSLTCLGIALFKPRIKNYHGISGAYKTITGGTNCVKDFIETFKTSHYDGPSLFFYKYNNADGKNPEALQMLKDNGFEIKETIGAFLHSKTETECMAVYHREKNFAAFFVSSMDMRIYHVLISFISLLFPKLFEEIPLKKPEDYEIAISLTKSDKNQFIKKIQESVKPYIMEFRRIMLGSLLKKMHESKIDSALSDVSAQRANVEMVQAQLANAIVQMKKTIAYYEGLKMTEAYDETEENFVEYLSTNSSLHNLYIENNKLSFTVATKLNNWNENVWETFNEREYIYDGVYGRNTLLDAFTTKSNRKLLLNNIFNESPEFAIKVAGNYALDLYNCTITSSRSYDYESADPMYKSYLANPHLRLFACLGAYRERVIKALASRNYISAVELCCASAGSVNLEETEQTFRPFLGWVMSSREKILIRKDGVEMTPEEALIYLIDKEKENETN